MLYLFLCSVYSIRALSPRPGRMGPVEKGIGYRIYDVGYMIYNVGIPYFRDLLLLTLSCFGFTLGLAGKESESKWTRTAEKIIRCILTTVLTSSTTPSTKTPRLRVLGSRISFRWEMDETLPNMESKSSSTPLIISWIRISETIPGKAKRKEKKMAHVSNILVSQDYAVFGSISEDEFKSHRIARERARERMKSQSQLTIREPNEFTEDDFMFGEGYEK